MITPSRGFLDAVFSDTTEEGRHLLTEAYTDLHLQQCPHADMKPPVSLSSLFEVMQFCVRRGHNLFHNGAGKVFMYEVLKLKHYVPQYGRRWFSKISTTTNPKTDWCGFVDGGVRGVVDIQVETEEGKVLGLGEVKGEGEGRYQVLAAMQAYRERTGTWPVVGFVADSETLQLMEPQERGGTHVTVQHTRFTTAKFDHLMSFVEQLVTALSVDIEPQMASLSLGEDAIRILARMDKLEKTIEDDRAMVGGRLQNIEESLKNLERMTNPPQPPPCPRNLLIPLSSEFPLSIVSVWLFLFAFIVCVVLNNRLVLLFYFIPYIPIVSIHCLCTVVCVLNNPFPKPQTCYKSVNAQLALSIVRHKQPLLATE